MKNPYKKCENCIYAHLHKTNKWYGFYTCKKHYNEICSFLEERTGCDDFEDKVERLF